MVAVGDVFLARLKPRNTFKNCPTLRAAIRQPDRFMQTDPTGYDDGLNWYAYVGNDPLNKNDPNGNESAQLSLQGIAGIEADERAYPGDHTSRNVVTLATAGAVSCALGCELLAPALKRIFNEITGKTTTVVTNSPERVSLLRSERSLARNVSEHRQKLAEYRRNPDAMDNKGTLANARNPAERQKIIDGRIKALEQQIKKNENELAKVRERLNEK